MVERGHDWREGDWLIADRQTAGRGRLGREWHDDAGNFMGSTLVRVGRVDPAPASLAFVAGLALYDAVGAAGATVRLKWPNDLTLEGAKLAGILLERVGDAVIVGIGVNLKSAPQIEGRATTSLAAAGHDVSRDQFAERLADAFVARVAEWRGGGWPSQVQRDWLVRAHPLGTPLAVHDGAVTLTGAFAGLEGDGALRFRLAGGEVRRISVGDVSLLADDLARADD